MKKSELKAMIVILIMAIFTNCATIIHGSTKEVSISSNPSRATITIDNRNKGKTPLTIKLSGTSSSYRTN